ncbi:hypothetical protein ACHAXS_012791 [Conticribra weissflogii]
MTNVDRTFWVMRNAKKFYKLRYQVNDIMMLIASGLLFLLSEVTPSSSFNPVHNNNVIFLSHRGKVHLASSQYNDQSKLVGVVAPLTYSGPYVCLGLIFPNLKSTKNCKQECGNQNGVAMKFVLDTGANINTVCKDVAEDLKLPTIMSKDDLSVLGSAGAGGSFETGDIVMLGDCQLDGMPKDQAKLIFMKNLTAASLKLGIGSVGHGLLGTSFFECFPAGVEFDWYGTDGDPPTLIFYYGSNLPDDAKKNARRVSLENDSFFGVPTVSVNINGVQLRAIIDTGSPISIVTPEAAKDAGLERIADSYESSCGRGIVRETPVKIKGVDHDVLDLAMANKATVSIGDLSLGTVKTMLIGELPGLSLASSFGVSKGPQVVLGLDILKQTYRVIFRLSAREIWIEPLAFKQ